MIMSTAQPIRSHPNASPMVPLSPSRKIVFVVDDDPSVLRGLQRLLKAHGFDAKLFDSAESFLLHAQVDEALCLVLDINLTGKSGIELRRELTAAGSSVPVIFMTANDSTATCRAAQDAGCIAYLPKPFSAQLLMEALRLAGARDLK